MLKSVLAVKMTKYIHWTCKNLNKEDVSSGHVEVLYL